MSEVCLLMWVVVVLMFLGDGRGHPPSPDEIDQDDLR